MALNVGATALSTIAKLAHDPSDDVRGELAETAPLFGPKSLPLLDSLSHDSS